MMLVIQSCIFWYDLCVWKGFLRILKLLELTFVAVVVDYYVSCVPCLRGVTGFTGLPQKFDDDLRSEL